MLTRLESPIRVERDPQANGKTSQAEARQHGEMQTFSKFKHFRNSNMFNLGASLLHDIRRVILSNGWLAGAGDFRK